MRSSPGISRQVHVHPRPQSSLDLSTSIGAPPPVGPGDPDRARPSSACHHQMAARHPDLAGGLGVLHHLPVPAGQGRRHQHDADAGRPGARLHQQVRLSPGADPTRRCRGVSLSPRYLQELHQARDRRGRRPGPHRRWPGLRQRPSDRRRLRSARSTKMFARTRRLWCRLIPTS